MYSLYIPCGDHEGLIPDDLLSRCGLHCLEDDCGPDVARISRQDWADVRAKNKLARVPEGDGEALLSFGIEFAIRQCRELIEGAIPGLHIYTMDRSASSIGIIDGLRSEGLL